MDLSDSEGKSVENDELYDLIIIGGGPAGLSAAIYSARAQLKTLVLDKSPSASAFVMAGKIENYPGVKNAISTELLDTMREQAVNFGVQYIQTQVTGVDFSDEIKEIITADKVYQSRAVIVATGAMGREPNIKGEEKLLGRGVSYCAICDAPLFSDKKVAVIGNTDEALEEAKFITKFAKKVWLISPTQELQAYSELYQKVTQNPKIELLLEYQLKEIQGEEQVENITLTDSSGEEKTLDLSAVFIYLQGNKPVVDFLYEAVKLSEDGCIVVQRNMSTSVEGVFAAGDVTCKQIRQVIIAAGEGAAAALGADKYLS